MVLAASVQRGQGYNFILLYEDCRRFYYVQGRARRKNIWLCRAKAQRALGNQKTVPIYRQDLTT